MIGGKGAQESYHKGDLRGARPFFFEKAKASIENKSPKKEKGSQREQSPLLKNLQWFTVDVVKAPVPFKQAGGGGEQKESRGYKSFPVPQPTRGEALMESQAALKESTRLNQAS